MHQLRAPDQAVPALGLLGCNLWRWPVERGEVVNDPDEPIPKRGKDGLPQPSSSRNTRNNTNNTNEQVTNGIVSSSPVVVKIHVVGASSARVRIRLFVERLSSSGLRVGARFVQLRDISGEPGDNGECASSDLFKEFGFYVHPSRDS
jgi:hypothetical protein